MHIDMSTFVIVNSPSNPMGITAWEVIYLLKTVCVHDLKQASSTNGFNQLLYS